MTNNGEYSEKAKNAVAVSAGLDSNPDISNEPFGHRPGDCGLLTLSSPTSIVMFAETEKHLMNAAHALKELYELTVRDLSSPGAIASSIKKLENTLKQWQERYGDDLIVQDTGTDYVGAAAVAESYFAKRFRMTKTDALGAMRALVKMKFAERRVYLTNDQLPVNRLAIVDCMPQIDTDPMFYFAYHIPKGRNVDGPENGQKPYLSRLQKAA